MVCCCCCTLLLYTFLIFAVIKAILKLLTKWDRSPTCLVGKTVIVTGANTGIGYYTALDFAKRGARVILACRNKNKAKEARDRIIEATGNPNVVVQLVDLASLESVREFAREINASEERLDILVNNAGLGWVENSTTPDGLSYIMQANHFGPFLLTNLLIDLLKRSAPSRIVNVSSRAAHFGKLDVNNLNALAEKGWKGHGINYSNSKLLNVLFTNELARRLEGTGVVTNSLHPGSVHTEFFRNMTGVRKALVLAIKKCLLKTAEEGAQTTIYVAVSNEINGVSGEYFENCKISWIPPMPKAARDEGLAKKVWEKSEDFVKLRPEERKL